MNISEHISYKEATYSTTANLKKINNTPDPETLKTMIVTACKVFEPVRRYFGNPILVTSFYRSPELNKVIGGAKNSQHVKGEAIDIKATEGFTNKQIFDWIKDNLEFDQVIAEGVSKNNISWVHVSHSINKNRKEVLLMYKINGRIKYAPYSQNNIINIFGSQ